MFMYKDQKDSAAVVETGPGLGELMLVSSTDAAEMLPSYTHAKCNNV